MESLAWVAENQGQDSKHAEDAEKHGFVPTRTV
jgi:hypothetical protein